MDLMRYEDRFKTSFITGPMVGVAFIVASMWFLVLMRGPEGALGPIWLPPLIILVVIALAWNYRIMTVQLYENRIDVGFGILPRRVSWGNVRSYRLVRGPEPRRGDLGYHINRVLGVWRVSYIAPVPDRVLVRLKKGLMREVFISVSRPDVFMSLLDHRIGNLRED